MLKLSDPIQEGLCLLTPFTCTPRRARRTRRPPWFFRLSLSLLQLTEKECFTSMFSQKSNKDVVSTNLHRRSFPRPLKWFIVSSLLVSMIAVTFAISANAVQKAHAASFTPIWSDEFNGASGTGVDTSKWLYDTGTGYGCSGCADHWGTNEVETATDSTSNVYQDGSGH